MSQKSLNLLLLAALVVAVAAGLWLSRRPAGEATVPLQPLPTGAATAEPTSPPAASGTGAPAATEAPAPAAEPARPLGPDVTRAKEAIERGDLAQARAALERVAPGDPDYPTALHNLGVLYEQQGEHARSRDAFRRLLALLPFEAEAWLGLGWAHFGLGEPLEAERATLRAVEANPNLVTARYNLGLYRLAQGRLAEASESYLRAMQLDRDQQGFRPALDDLQALARKRPDLAAAHYILALLYNAIGERDWEAKELEAFLATGPAGAERRVAEERLAAARAVTGAASATSTASPTSSTP